MNWPASLVSGRADHFHTDDVVDADEHPAPPDKPPAPPDKLIPSPYKPGARSDEPGALSNKEDGAPN